MLYALYIRVSITQRRWTTSKDLKVLNLHDYALDSVKMYIYGSFHQVWGTICDGVNCYIRKCTIYYPWLWLLINIIVISYWRWRDWFHSNLKNNCECALIIKDNRWYIYGCNNWHRHKSCPTPGGMSHMHHSAAKIKTIWNHKRDNFEESFPAYLLFNQDWETLFLFCSGLTYDTTIAYTTAFWHTRNCKSSDTRQTGNNFVKTHLLWMYKKKLKNVDLLLLFHTSIPGTALRKKSTCFFKPHIDRLALLWGLMHRNSCSFSCDKSNINLGLYWGMGDEA